MKLNVLAKWFQALTNAWNRGEADWAYADGTSEVVRVWATARERYSEPEANQITADWIAWHGITLKRSRDVR